MLFRLKTIISFLFFLTGVVYSQVDIDFQKIDRLKSEDRIDEAIDIVEGYLKRNNEDFYLYNLLGELYIAQNTIESRKKAEIAFDEVIKINKNFIPAIFNKALLKEQIGDFWNAKKLLKRVINIDSDYTDAYLQLFRIYLKDKQTGSIYKAEDLINELSKKNFENKKNLILLGLLYKEMGDFNKSESFLKKYLIYDSTSVKCYLTLSDISFQIGDFKNFTEYYYKAIESIENKSELQTMFLNTKDIISKEQRDEFFLLKTIEEKKKWLLSFWKQKDPNIFTDDNERLVEHKKRVIHSKNVFGMPVSKGYDDRGEIYVKYGEPIQAFKRPGGSVLMLYNSLIETRPNETWVYYNIHPHLSFDFVEIGAIYKEVENLSYALISLKSSELVQELYKERSYLGNDFLNLSTGNIETTIMKFVQEREKAKSSVPSDYYKLEKDDSNLEFIIDYAQFKSGYNRTKIVLYSGVLNSDLSFKKDSSGNKSAVLNNRIIFLDSLANRAVDFENHKVLISPPEGFDDQSYLLDINQLDIIPGDYLFGIEYYSEDYQNCGFIQKDIYIRSFDKEKLELSDILFVYNVTPEKEAKKLSIGGMELIPMPYPVIDNKRELGLYFEIYNLEKDEYGEISYNLSYEIIKQKDDKSIFEQIFSKLKGDFTKPVNISSNNIQKGEKTGENNLIFLDISTLNKGNFIIKIEITDLSDNETETTSKEFQIVESS